MYYKVTGSTGSRVLTMEWKNMRSYSSTNSAYNWTNYQVKLYEGSNIVKLCYGSFTYNYSCSIHTYLTADGKMTKLTGSYANPAVETNTTGSTTAISVNSASTAPANGTVYTFAPFSYTWTANGTQGTANGDTYTVTPTENSSYTASVTVGGQTYSETVDVMMAPAAPTGLSVSNITTNSATVSWSGNASSYSYSIDGTNWTTTSNTTANLTGLTMGTTYNFQVKAVDGDCESDVASVQFQTMSTVEIQVVANPAEGGTVTGGGTYDYDDPVTITATANEGYTFTNWTKGGTEVSTSASYSFNATEDAT